MRFAAQLITAALVALMAAVGSRAACPASPAPWTVEWALDFRGCCGDYNMNFGAACHGPSSMSYASGIFTHTLTIGGTDVTTDGSAAVYLAKFDAKGNAVWVTSYPQTTPDYDLSYGLVVHQPTGDVFNSGAIGAGIIIGPYTLVNTGRQQPYVTRIAPDGTVKWAVTFPCSASLAALFFGTGVDEAGNSVSGGYMASNSGVGTMTVGSTTLATVGGWDPIVVKLDPNGNPLWAVSFPCVPGYNSQLNGVAVQETTGNSYVVGPFRNRLEVGGVILTGSTSYSLAWVAKVCGWVCSDLSPHVPQACVGEGRANGLVLC